MSFLAVSCYNRPRIENIKFSWELNEYRIVGDISIFSLSEKDNIFYYKTYNIIVDNVYLLDIITRYILTSNVVRNLLIKDNGSVHFLALGRMVSKRV